MDELSFVFPFPIGSYLKKEEKGIEHIDKLEEYIITKNGIYATLILDINKNPRIGNRISMDRLIEEWTLSEQVEDKNVKVKKRSSITGRKQ